MQPEQIAKIVEAATAYLAEKNLTAKELAIKANISQTYLSYMLKGQATMKVDSKEVEIKGKYWAALATFLGVNIHKAHWELVPTLQFKRMIHEMTEAKKTGTARAMIGDTGAGKTYAIEQYQRQYPNHTYVVTINSVIKLSDIINELLHQLGKPMTGTIAMRLSQLIIALRDIKRMGGWPQIILTRPRTWTPIP